MAKDPAVLFYTQDFLVGTMTMSMEQKGKYIHLLCLQHQKSKLTLKDLQSVLTDEDVDVAEKFSQYDDGFYYNIRMQEEADKRKKYTESRRNNRIKKTSDIDVSKISKSYVNSYVNRMENENATVNVNEVATVNANINSSNNTSTSIDFDKLINDIKSARI
jgi:hypothetical protein